MSGEQKLLLGMLVWGVINSLVGYWLGTLRGRPGLGAAAAVVLGPVGWLLILAAEDWRPRCPECRELVRMGATRCPHCGIEIEMVLRS